MSESADRRLFKGGEMAKNPVKVLVVDDEAAMHRGICVSLKARGYAVDEARTGEEAVESFHEQRPDLVLLDINMPGMSGIEACRRIRAEAPNAAIVMISIRDTEEDAVQALEAGADDCITKPFRVRELLARLSAVTRRARVHEAHEPPILRAGFLELDTKNGILRKAGDEIHLSPTEFGLLQYLMQNPNVPLHHIKLLRAVWGLEYGQELEYLRTYIRMLRKKIERDPAHPEYILTEPWLGYRFRDPSAPQGADLAPTERRVTDGHVPLKAVA
jgi:two-component system, OmpR family, KDP operon response regulator KdpE